MNRFNYFVLFLIISLLTVGLTVDTFARPEERKETPAGETRTGFHRSGYGILPHLFRTARWELELSETQERDLREIHKKFSLDMVDLQADLQREQIELKDLLSTHSPDFSSVRHRIRDKNEIIGDIQLRRIEFGEDLLDILTSEQLGQLPDDFLHRISRYGMTGFGVPSGRREDYRPRQEKRSHSSDKKEGSRRR